MIDQAGMSGDAAFLEFVHHLGLAVLGFFLILVAAVILHLSTGMVRRHDLIPRFIVVCVEGLAIALFLIDLLGFVAYVGVEAWNYLGDLRAMIH